MPPRRPLRCPCSISRGRLSQSSKLSTRGLPWPQLDACCPPPPDWSRSCSFAAMMGYYLQTTNAAITAFEEKLQAVLAKYEPLFAPAGVKSLTRGQVQARASARAPRGGCTKCADDTLARRRVRRIYVPADPDVDAERRPDEAGDVGDVGEPDVYRVRAAEGQRVHAAAAAGGEGDEAAAGGGVRVRRERARARVWSPHAVFGAAVRSEIAARGCGAGTMCERDGPSSDSRPRSPISARERRKGLPGRARRHCGGSCHAWRQRSLMLQSPVATAFVLPRPARAPPQRGAVPPPSGMSPPDSYLTALAPLICTAIAAAAFVHSVRYHADRIGGVSDSVRHHADRVGTAVETGGASTAAAVRECAHAARAVSDSADSMRRVALHLIAARRANPRLTRRAPLPRRRFVRQHRVHGSEPPRARPRRSGAPGDSARRSHLSRVLAARGGVTPARPPPWSAATRASRTLSALCARPHCRAARALCRSRRCPRRRR